MKSIQKSAFYLLLLLPVIGLSQRPENPDSLMHLLPTLKGIEKVKVLNNLSLSYLGIDYEKTKKYAEEALVLSENLGNDSLIISSLIYLSSAFENAGYYHESIPVNNRARELAKKIDNKDQLVSALSHLCLDFFQTQQLDKVLSTTDEGIALAKNIKDTINTINFYEMYANLYLKLKNYALAEKYWKEEIEIINQTDRLFELGRAYVNLSNLYSETNRNKEAIKYLEKSIPVFEKLNYQSGIAIINVNLGDEYLRTGDYSKSKLHYGRAMDLNKTIANPSIEGNAKAGLGKVALENKDFTLSEKLLLHAEELGKETQDLELLNGVYNYLEDLYMATHDFKNANLYHAKFTESADSLLSQSIKENITEYQVKYETAKKDQEILEQQNQIFRQQAWFIGLIIGVLALALLIYLFYNRYRLRQRAILDAAVIKEQKQGLQAVIEAQENERRRIAKDLHDGIAQEMVAMKLGFNLVRKKIEKANPKESSDMLDLENRLNDSCTEIRNIAHMMIPPILEHNGLISSIELLIRNSLQAAGLKTEFECFSLPAKMEEKIEIGIYRIAQELFNNILKHAKAKKVLVQLYKAGDSVILRVEDDGIGFDYEEEKKKGSMGLLNILSRVNALEGNFVSERATKKGTISTLRIQI